MNDKEKAKAIANMVKRRKEAIRAKLWEDTALHLLKKHGSLKAEDVDRLVDETIAEITDQQLADQVAAKAVASIEYHRNRLSAIMDAADGARAKVEKFEELVNNTRQDLKNAQLEIEAVRTELSDAEEIAEYAIQRGDPTAAPNSGSTVARSEVATGEGGVS